MKKKTSFLLISCFLVIFILGGCEEYETNDSVSQPEPGIYDPGENETHNESTEPEPKIGEFKGNETYNELCKPGQKRYGGIVVSCADNESVDLIAMEEDISQSARWGCKGTKVGAESDTDGDKNTNKIVENCTEEKIAARLCEESEEEGYTDWYLPSQNELTKLYENKDVIKGLSGSFWSSTESHNYDKRGSHAFVHTNEYVKEATKESNHSVRCVRRFNLTQFQKLEFKESNDCPIRIRLNTPSNIFEQFPPINREEVIISSQKDYEEIVNEFYKSLYESRIKDDEEYEDYSFEEFFQDCNSFPRINFEKKTLLASGGSDSGCSCEINRRISRDDSEKRFVYNYGISGINPGDVSCAMMCKNWEWILVPKVPSDYDISIY